MHILTLIGSHRKQGKTIPIVQMVEARLTGAARGSGLGAQKHCILRRRSNSHR